MNVDAPNVNIDDLLLDGRIRLEDMVDRDGLDELCSSFLTLFGIPIRNYSSDGAVLAKAGEEYELCAYVNDTPGGRKECASIVGAVKVAERHVRTLKTLRFEKAVDHSLRLFEMGGSIAHDEQQ